jgi:starvation-inducible outer membrane lipoprotein
MNKNRGIFFASMALLVAGCATGPTRLERAYGLSYHVARVSQTLHPEAATNLAPLLRFDGKAAKHTLDRYYATFEKPPPPPSFVISVGGIK